jgi:hypothetical protein
MDMEEGEPCQICGREYNFQKFVGSCSGDDCKVNNMCEDCGVFFDDEWHCEDCSHCERCDLVLNGSEFIGNCLTHGCFERMCHRCGYYDGNSWYCEDCRDKLIDAGDWIEEKDDWIFEENEDEE